MTWANGRGFRFSDDIFNGFCVCFLFFFFFFLIRKQVGVEVKLSLYNQELEAVKLLGIWFNERLTRVVQGQ